MNRETVVKATLRIALIWGFLYPATSSFLHPLDWIVFFPNFMRGHFIPDQILLVVTSVFNTLLALWFIYGRYLFIPSVIATAYLGIILISNLRLLEVTHLTLSLMLVSLALAFWTYPRVLSRPLGE